MVGPSVKQSPVLPSHTQARRPLPRQGAAGRGGPGARLGGGLLQVVHDNEGEHDVGRDTGRGERRGRRCRAG
jgi:hypothetical protein